MEYHMLDKNVWNEIRQKTGSERGQHPIVQKSGYVYVGREYADMEARVFAPSPKESQVEDFSVHMLSISLWDENDSIDDLKKSIEEAKRQAISKERKALLDKALSKLISKSKDNPLLQDPSLERWREEWDAIKSLIVACDIVGNCLLKHDYPLSDKARANYDPNKMITTSLDLIDKELFEYAVNHSENIS